MSRYSDDKAAAPLQYQERKKVLTFLFLDSDKFSSL